MIAHLPLRQILRNIQLSASMHGVARFIPVSFSTSESREKSKGLTALYATGTESGPWNQCNDGFQ
jgi:hypothetical protein